MAYYIYQGDPLMKREGPQIVTAFGVRFERGEPSKVEDDAICAKLDRNGHFKKVDGRRYQAEAAKRQAETEQAEQIDGDVHKD